MILALNYQKDGIARALKKTLILVCLRMAGFKQFFNTKGIKTGGDDGGPTTNHRWFRGVKARIVPDMSDNFQPYSGWISYVFYLYYIYIYIYIL